MPCLKPVGCAFLVTFACLISATSARAVVLSGEGGQGVPVGQSSLIGQLDYSDTFTGNDDGGLVPDRVYGGLRGQEAYMVENTYGNPAAQFTQLRNDPGVIPARPFQSFAADREGTPGLVPGTASPYPGPSGAGTNTGFMQSGGGIDYGIPYGLRDEYIVQFDATQPNDRVDITSAAVPGTIGAAGAPSLSVFFRGPGWATNATHGNNISLYNGVTDTPIRGQPGYEEFSTGLSDITRAWHNYAVRFDAANEEIEIFLDEVSLGVIDLNTFAGGIYAGFSNAAVSVGGTAGDRIWSDNFQVGAPIPEPGTLAASALGLLVLAARPRRRA